MPLGPNFIAFCRVACNVQCSMLNVEGHSKRREEELKQQSPRSLGLGSPLRSLSSAWSCLGLRSVLEGGILLVLVIQ